MKKHIAIRLLAMVTALMITGAKAMPVSAEGTEGTETTEISQSENRVAEDDADETEPEAYVEETAEEEKGSAVAGFDIGVDNGKYYIKAYTGDSAVVEIPDNDGEGHTITVIGEGVFEGKTNITSITIPETITTIYRKAFAGCTGLKSVTINATELIDCSKYNYESAMFYNAGVPEGMTITFGPKVTRIPAYIFFTGVYDKKSSTNYAKVSKVVISDSVTEIGEAAFANCWDLKEVEGGAGVKKLVEWAFQDTGLLKYPAGFKAVESIGKQAFADCPAFAEAILPEGLTYIGEAAFENDYALKKVSLPATLLTLSKAAFRSCTGLETLSFNSKELKDCEKYNYESAFFYNAGLPSGMTVTFESGVKRIPAYLFFTGVYDKNDSKNYTRVSKVVISDTVTEVGEAALANCWDLKEVEGGSAITKVERWGFQNTALTKFPTSFKAVESIYEGGFGNTAMVEATLPEGLTYIGAQSFADNYSLATISLPVTLTTIDKAAFKNCTALKNVTIKSKELKDLSWTSDSAAFYNAGVEVGDGFTVTFTQGVTHIPACIFGVNRDKNSSKDWCRLYEVYIPGTVKDVGDWAFQGCYGLKKIHFQGKAPKIGDNAFYNCEADAFYPDGDKSWTKDKCKDYGGKLTWKTESGKPGGGASRLTEEILDSAVTFITNGAEETAPYYKINKSGKKAKLVTLHKKGYTFKGWYFNGKKVKTLTPKLLRKNPAITLEAKFTPNKYKIVYKVSKKAYGVKVKGKIKLTKEEKKISYEGGMLTGKGTELTCEGYTLKGWSLTKGGSDIVVGVGETVSLEKLIPDKGKTIKLYPVWQ
ncbi:MAG: leucine-rich repeat protein [Lachnospiraceae bacterium]|nr:leucine-rich repeat protein [Lachnospiraceae bacterium]